MRIIILNILILLACNLVLMPVFLYASNSIFLFLAFNSIYSIVSIPIVYYYIQVDKTYDHYLKRFEKK